MKKFRKLIMVGAVVLIIAATSITAFAAAGYSNPAEIIADLTNQSADSVIAEKTESGTTYGAIASEAGVLDAFKAQMLEWKTSVLAERVASGRITQEQADAAIAAMQANMANCDGTGSGGTGACSGLGIGGMGGQGRGNGGTGSGRGMGMCSGSGQAA